MNIEKLKAARGDFIHIDECDNLYDNKMDVFVIDARHADLIRTLLDQAINAPDLESLKREIMGRYENA